MIVCCENVHTVNGGTQLTDANDGAPLGSLSHVSSDDALYAY